MKLKQAFGIHPGEVVSLIGAGGKTSTLVALAHELAEQGWRVLTTTTTRIDADQLALMPAALRPNAGVRAIADALNQHRFVFLYEHIRDGRVYGPAHRSLSRLLDTIDSDALIIEADHANSMPLKAPYAHEPVILPETTLAIAIAGLAALGQPLDDEHIYNARAMIDRYGFYEGSPVRSPWVAQVLRDEELGLRGVPPDARVMTWLNGVPASGYLRGRARMISRLVLRSPRVYGAAIGAARAADPVHEVQRNIGAIVLAAGMSRRMGTPKVLLQWNGTTILEHILRQMMLAKVDHVVTVIGSRAEEVSVIARRLEVTTAYNQDYETGEMLSSVKAGLRAMPSHVAAALIVLGDQPSIQARTVLDVINAYAEGKGEIVAPSYQMRRGHPILIDRRYWPEILALPDAGAVRDVINTHAREIAYVKVDNDSVLRDLDTPQDYQEARRLYGG